MMRVNGIGWPDCIRPLECGGLEVKESNDLREHPMTYVSSSADARHRDDVGSRSLRTPLSKNRIACRALIFCGLMSAFLAVPEVSMGQARCAVLEFYVRNDTAGAAEAEAALQQLVSTRKGLKLQKYNLDEEGPHVARFEQIRKYFRITEEKVPAVFLCNYLLSGWKDIATLKQQVATSLKLTVYVRSGCPKCAAAKVFLKQYGARYPCFTVELRDVIVDEAALTRFKRLAQRYRQSASSLPGFHFCNQLSVGFINEQISGKQLLQKLDRWTVVCKQDKTSFLDGNWRTPDFNVARVKSTLNAIGENGRLIRRTAVDVTARSLGAMSVSAAAPAAAILMAMERQLLPVNHQDDEGQLPGGQNADGEGADDDLPPLPGGDDLPPLPGGDDLPPLPGGDDAFPGGDGDLPGLPPLGDEGGAPSPLPFDDSDPILEDDGGGGPPITPGKGTIEVPFFGELDLSRLGMPALTILVGLVDGFNPCAMWVLMFLLSLLVNLKSRVRIIAVAGTFVFISGLAYFMFMTIASFALDLVNFGVPAMVTLGLLAVFVGSIHVKDFFAFKKGISLSIPESAKPGIYARSRKIIMAENLVGAVISATILAVLVNVIELACTAGLPTLYLGILKMQGFTRTTELMYILLYNLAYMFDDGLMVGIVVFTMEKVKLQEKGGRILKLISGSFILLLGLYMFTEAYRIKSEQNEAERAAEAAVDPSESEGGSPAE